MKKLRLNNASRKMASEVGFVAAIPIVQPSTNFYEPSPVCGIIYFDSRDDGFDLSEGELAELTSLIERMVESVRLQTKVPLNRLENTPLRQRSTSARPAERIPEGVSRELFVPNVCPPATSAAFLFNYDHSDITPLAD